MDEVFGLVIVLIGLVSVFSEAVKKGKTKKEPPIPTVKAGHPYTVTAQNPPAKTIPPKATPAKPASMATMLPPRDAAQPAAPAYAPVQLSIHDHLEPDCDTHDAPSGSLNAVSPEGKDPCHEDQMQPRTTFPEAEEHENSLDLDWSADGMVKAFIMQEVLTRPHQRRMAR